MFFPVKLALLHRHKVEFVDRLEDWLELLLTDREIDSFETDVLFGWLINCENIHLKGKAVFDLFDKILKILKFLKSGFALILEIFFNLFGLFLIWLLIDQFAFHRVDILHVRKDFAPLRK